MFFHLKRCLGNANNIRHCGLWNVPQAHRFLLKYAGWVKFPYLTQFVNHGAISPVPVGNLPHIGHAHAKKHLSLSIIRSLSFSINHCWKCNSIVAERDLVCLSCGSIQEPNDKLNYFEIFKEGPNFDIDVRNLAVKFRRLQTLLHPDKFAARSDKEKGYSAEQSSKVNKAYQVLYRPVERGLYLLKLYGKPLLEGEIVMPPEFLEEMMETFEALSNEVSAEALETIRHKNDARLEMLFTSLSLAFKEKNIDRARELLARLKYHENIDSRIKNIEEKLGINRDD